MSPATLGYQAPTVTVSSSLPKRGVGDAVLIIPVISDDDTPKVLAAEPYLDADAVGEIEAGLRALGATGGTDQLHRLVVPALPVASVLAVGLGAQRDEWTADVIRRAAGVAARSLDKVEAVVTTLSAVDFAGATVEGLILGAYQFNEFRSDKTAPKDAGLRKITVLPGPAVSTRAAKTGGRAGRRGRDRGGHRTRLRQHPAQPPVPRRIR